MGKYLIRKITRTPRATIVDPAEIIKAKTNKTAKMKARKHYQIKGGEWHSVQGWENKNIWRLQAKNVEIILEKENSKEI